jgi:hypothetical protein
VRNIQAWTDAVEQKCREKAHERIGADFTLELRIIGLNATLGAQDWNAKIGSEVGVLGIITAPSEIVAKEVSKMLKPLPAASPTDRRRRDADIRLSLFTQ